VTGGPDAGGLPPEAHGAVPVRRAGWKGLLSRAAGPLRVVLLLAIIGFAAYALTTSWEEVRGSLGEVGWLRLVLAGLVLAVSTGGQLMGWRRCLDALGAPHIPPGPAAAIFATSQAAKYMPGSVWPAVIQGEMGRRYDVPRRTMLASYAYILLQSVAAAGVLSVLALAGPTAGWARLTAVLATLGGCGLVVALQFPQVFHRVLDVAFRRFTGSGMPAGVRRGPLNRGFVWVVSAWFLGGIATWLLAAPLGVGAAELPFVVGASALAWVVGLVVVIVPAGAGVREVVLVLTLGQVIGTPQALTVAVLSRFLQLVVDLLLAAALGLPHYARMRAAR
jgi:uncharacterized membrane protein YbhN (UPF0104 family)